MRVSLWCSSLGTDSYGNTYIVKTHEGEEEGEGEGEEDACCGTYMEHVALGYLFTIGKGTGFANRYD